MRGRQKETVWNRKHNLPFDGSASHDLPTGRTVIAYLALTFGGPWGHKQDSKDRTTESRVVEPGDRRGSYSIEDYRLETGDREAYRKAG